tara:strand:- start:130 stop:534 length:405 start_codon:yes stop_codon:yes gene_type:complete
MTLTAETNQTFLRSYVDDYCKAITKNYADYHNDRGYSMIDGASENLMKFEVREGRSYYKIVQCEYDERRGEYRDQSVHSFVGKIEKNLGNVYKPASWSAPHTKHVRFRFTEVKDLKFLLDSRNLDWAGGYLYLR